MLRTKVLITTVASLAPGKARSLSWKNYRGGTAKKIKAVDVNGIKTACMKKNFFVERNYRARKCKADRHNKESAESNLQDSDRSNGGGTAERKRTDAKPWF